jgi:hypothetical protein
LLDGAAVAEVTGACFCCKLDDLVAVVARLQRDERPDVILCEPVGSCTDLVATVVRPLESLYQTGFLLTPFTVLLDARRALTTFGGVRRKRDFAKDVGYIFRKQVEEADGLFVNKVELLEAGDEEKLRAALAKAFPGKQVSFGSAKTGAGVAEWMEECFGIQATGGTPVGHDSRDGYPPLEIDYAVYARGEAMLGWYNARLGLEAAAPLDGNAWLLERAREIAAMLDGKGMEVAHFKAALAARKKTGRQTTEDKNPLSEGDPIVGEVAIVNQVLSGEEPTLSREMDGLVTTAELLVNLRAEGDADCLRAIVREVLEADSRVTLIWHDEAAFQPGEPKPTHRITAGGGGVIG